MRDVDGRLSAVLLALLSLLLLSYFLVWPLLPFFPLVLLPLVLQSRCHFCDCPCSFIAILGAPLAMIVTLPDLVFACFLVVTVAFIVADVIL